MRCIGAVISAKLLFIKELLAPISLGLQADLIPKNDPKPVKTSKKDTKSAQNTWPSTLPLQISAIAQLLASAAAGMSLLDIEASFKGQGPWKKGLPRILETLEALGRARREGAGWRAV